MTGEDATRSTERQSSMKEFRDLVTVLGTIMATLCALVLMVYGYLILFGMVASPRSQYLVGLALVVGTWVWMDVVAIRSRLDGVGGNPQ